MSPPIAGSKGSALGGSRAEPWVLLPFTRLPGLETDMRSTPCSTSIWSSATRSKATRSMGCCKQPRTPSLDPALQPRHRAQPSDPGDGGVA